jgi:hypothetical protein
MGWRKGHVYGPEDSYDDCYDDADDDRTPCEKCGERMEDRDCVEYNDLFYCDDCATKLDFFCAQCGKISNVLTAQPSCEETLCDDCIAKIKIEENEQ